MDVIQFVHYNIFKSNHYYYMSSECIGTYPSEFGLLLLQYITIPAMAIVHPTKPTIIIVPMAISVFLDKEVPTMDSLSAVVVICSVVTEMSVVVEVDVELTLPVVEGPVELALPVVERPVELTLPVVEGPTVVNTICNIISQYRKENCNRISTTISLLDHPYLKNQSKEFQH
jgi:hypothetical protein